MALRQSLRPVLSQLHPIPILRLYSASPNPNPAGPNSSASEASSSKQPTIPIPTPSQSEPLPSNNAVEGKKPVLELPQLPRPLGVTLLPSSEPKTWSDKKESYLNEDRQKAKRKALFKEASQGYFHDYNKARKAFGGKLWTAPNTLIREDVSH
jgi:ATPase complex subunit ATP10